MAGIVGASLMLVACSSAGAAHDRRGADTVAELARAISDERPDDINGFAREAALRGEGGAGSNSHDARLIGIEPFEPDTINDPLGRLTFAVEIDLHPVTRDDPATLTNCFQVEFDYYGYTGDRGLAGADDPAIVGVDCPADPVTVVPPPDTSEHPVVPDNAEAVIMDVLSALPADVPPDADQVTESIRSRLDLPTGEFEVLADVGVQVEGADVGVAMGDTDSCVLFLRSDGVVEQLHVPRVLLQPGEYGCRPSTALVDADQLRSPH
jgi:hypothetical protein